MSFLVVLCVFFTFLGGVCQTEAKPWSMMSSRKVAKIRVKTWQVQILTEKGEPLIYVIQSTPPQVRIFASHTRYYHPLSLESFGINKITDVGLQGALKEKGQTLYLGDKTTQRVLSIVLGTKEIKEESLAPGMQSYREFIAQLHPVAETERHL